MSQTLLEDTKHIVSDKNIPWEKMRDSRILVTGATGNIGSAIVRALRRADFDLNLNIKVLALGRDLTRAKKIIDETGIEFIYTDICEPISVQGRLDYIFHCAAITDSSEMLSNPVGVIETSISGTRNILNLAKNKKVKGVVYLSSMEVYGITDPRLNYVMEDNLGYIDLKKPRSCYPESKRMCENLCNCYFSQYDIQVKIARLAQTFGAGCRKDDPRVFAQFARNAVGMQNIVLHTEGKSQGNYCYTADAVRALILLLLKGECGDSYNIANPSASVTIREMAEIVAQKVCEGKISVVINVPHDIERRGYAPDVKMKLSADKIQRLGWEPKYDLTEMYKRMIADWRDQ